MTRPETLALIAIIGASVAVGGFFWQLFHYWLSGARLRVRLRPAVLDSAGTLFRGPANARWRLADISNTVTRTSPTQDYVDSGLRRPG